MARKKGEEANEERTSPKRMTISVPQSTAEQIDFVAGTELTSTRAISQCIATEYYLYHERQNGGKIILERKDGSKVEIFFR